MSATFQSARFAIAPRGAPGVRGIAWRALHAVASRTIPPCLYQSRDSVFVAARSIDPERVPVLRGHRSRMATEDDIDALCKLTRWHRPRSLHRMFRAGSICAVAEDDNGIAACNWAFPGPGICRVDAGYKEGLRWVLAEHDAWMHNGVCRRELIHTGVYLAAYRQLLHALRARGIRRCCGIIGESNVSSRKTHERLGLRPAAAIAYRRFVFAGRFEIRGRRRREVRWTFRKTLLLDAHELADRGAA